MTPYSRKRRNVFSKLLGVKQETLDGWMQAIENRLKLRKEAETMYGLNATKLFKLLKQAHEGGMSLRELADITGVSHATIASWIKMLEASNAQESNALPTQ
jgi:transposase-like protein